MIDVIVVGGGPAGTMLASELRLHDVHVVVLERDTEPTEVCPRARPARARHRGDGPARSAGAFPRGRPAEPGGRWGFRRHRQAAARAAGHRTSVHARNPAAGQRTPLGRTRRRARRRAPARLRSGRVEPGRGRRHRRAGRRHRLRSRYLVGCDGGRSTVRKLLGIAFPGEPNQARDVAGRDGAECHAGGSGGGECEGPQDPAPVRRRAHRGRVASHRRASSRPRRGP